MPKCPSTSTASGRTRNLRANLGKPPVLNEKFRYIESLTKFVIDTCAKNQPDMKEVIKNKPMLLVLQPNCLFICISCPFWVLLWRLFLHISLLHLEDNFGSLKLPQASGYWLKHSKIHPFNVKRLVPDTSGWFFTTGFAWFWLQKEKNEMISADDLGSLKPPQGSGYWLNHSNIHHYNVK